MKTKLPAIIFFLVCSLSMHAQTLYSVTANGGAQNFGTIYSYLPATNSLTVKKTFLATEGKNASGSLLRANNGKLYGVTIFGGTFNFGTIYSFEPATSVYTTLYNFNNTTGSSPLGGLIQATNGKLYGMTEAGGSDNNGFIYSFDITTSTFAIVKDLAFNDGVQPFGKLFQATNGKLYGLTRLGGTSNLGVIFSVDPVTNVYTKLREFDNRFGYNPFGEFIQMANGRLYGMATSGGLFGWGVIFSYDPVTSIYTDQVDFTGYAPGNLFDNGGYPYGSLVKAPNSNLYGMTFYGGANNVGAIFEWDPVTTICTKMKDFSLADGSHPYGALFLASDEKLYGVTGDGGTNNLGVIFSYDPLTFTYKKLRDLDAVSGANPYWGATFIEPVIVPALVTYYRDADGDGYGDGFVKIKSATPPAGYVKNDYDCDDHKKAMRTRDERVRMCHGGLLECVFAKDIIAKLALGWTLGLCPKVSPAPLSGTAPGTTAPSIPGQYAISSHPNPFAVNSTIRYDIPMESKVTIKVFDQLGRTVSILVNETKKAGSYTVKFDAGAVSNGALYYRLSALSKKGLFEQTNRMIQLQ